MKVVLDTHIIVYSNSGQLSESRQAIIQNSNTVIYISQISLWEITKLCEHKRISPQKGLEHLLFSIYNHPSYNIVDFSPQVLLELYKLAPKVHRDPADQIILATALNFGAKLMTNDKLIISSGIVETV